MKQARSVGGLIWSAVLVTATVGCGPAAVTLDRLPLPPFAVEGKYNGGYETRVGLAIMGARNQLEPSYGPLDVGDFALMDEEKGWNDIEAFYAQSGVQRTLADAGFMRQNLTSGRPGRSQLAIWTRKRSFGKDELLAALYVPGNPDDPLNFMLRLHAPAPKR